MSINAIMPFRALSSVSKKVSTGFQSVERYSVCFGPRGPQIYFDMRRRAKKQLEMHPASLAHPVSLRIGTSDVPVYMELICDEVYALDLVAAPRVIIDAGANVGLASAYFATRYPEARIFALEPEASNFERLVLNTASYPRITVIQKALWSVETRLPLFTRGNKAGFSVLDSADTVGDEGWAETATISSLMEEFNFDEVDLLKIDIEGAEAEVFDSSAEWIDNVNVIVAEMHDRIKPGCSRAFYKAIEAFPSERYTGDAVVVARPGFIQGE